MCVSHAGRVSIQKVDWKLLQYKHSVQWKNADYCTRTTMHGNNHHNTKFILNKSRRNMRLLIGSMTGHRMVLSETESCSHCVEEGEISIQLQTSCSTLTNCRRRNLGHDLHWAEEQIQGAKVKGILNFMKEATARQIPLLWHAKQNQLRVQIVFNELYIH